MTIHEILKTNSEARECLIAVWENRNEGTHGWVKIDDALWMTFEPESEDGEDYIWTMITDSVDFLGYPMGEALDWATFYDKDIAHYRRKNRKVA